MPLRERYGSLLKIATPVINIKKIKWQEQKGKKWCWVACASMVLKSFKAGKANKAGKAGQCEIAGEILSGNCSSAIGAVPCNLDGYALPCCDTSFPVEKIESLWSCFGINVVTVRGALHWDETVEALEAGPIEIFLCGDDSLSGHLILITGVDTNSPGKRWVSVADPASDHRDISPVDFDSLVAGELGAGKWVWTWMIGLEKEGIDELSSPR